MPKTLHLRDQAMVLVKQLRDQPNAKNEALVIHFRQQSEQHLAAVTWAEQTLSALSSAPKREFSFAERQIIRREALIAKWTEPKKQLQTAAVICVCVLLGWGTFNVYSVRDKPVELVKAPVVNVQNYSAARQHKEVTLEDGTVLWLDWHSQAEVRYTAQNRQVKLLKGRAAFKVTSNPQRPFLVFAGNATTLVTGTEFVVDKRESSSVSVTVLEGNVEVSNRQSTVALRQSEGVSVSESAPLKAVTIDAADNTAWRQGQLVLTNLPIIDAIEKLKPYTSYNIDMQALSDFDGRVSAVYFTHRADDALVGLIKTHRLRAEQNGWNIVLRPPAPRRPY